MQPEWMGPCTISEMTDHSAPLVNKGKQLNAAVPFIQLKPFIKRDMGEKSTTKFFSTVRAPTKGGQVQEKNVMLLITSCQTFQTGQM